MILFCLLSSHTETIAVNVSVAGVAIHTPVIPHMAGKTKVNISSRTNPRREEIRADDPASPQLVKYMELITSYPMNKNVTAKKRKPDNTISAT